MPTYKNNGTAMAMLGGQRIEAGETLSTTEWFGSLPAGVVKTADAPFLNPIVYSLSTTTSGSYAIPANLTGNYKITAYCAAGGVAVKLNSSDGTARNIGLYESYVTTCLSRTVASIIWTISSGTLVLTVEKI
jgi:ABC-type multidrug transport system permease subunit